MGSKRVGLARIQALIENLKRDIALGTTTLSAATLSSTTGLTAPSMTSKTQLANAASGVLAKNTWYLAPADGAAITVTLPTQANSTKGDVIVVQYNVVIDNGATHKYGTSGEFFMVGSSIFKRAAVEIFSVDVSDATDDFLNLIGLTNCGPGIGSMVIFTFNGSTWQAEATCTASGNGSATNLSVFATS